MIYPRRCLFLLLLLSFEVNAQVTDPQWPCVQVLVPEIVSAVVWPLPIDESLTGTWNRDETLVTMVNQLSDLDELTDTNRQLIAEFVKTIPEALRIDRLNQLADGIVTLSNRRRTRLITGIKRYTRQQSSIANQIESTLNQLVEQSGSEGYYSASRDRRDPELASTSLRSARKGHSIAV